MRPATRWLLVLLAGLALCAPLPAAKTERPRVAVVVARVHLAGEEGPKGAAGVSVIGGYVKGKGWLKSERAGPLMQRGDRMVLYTLDPPGRRVGEVELTNNEQDQGANEESNEWGWTFEARVSQAPKERPVLGVWRTSAIPEPKWIVGNALSRDNVVYRAEVLAWLKSRGVPEAARKKTEIGQIIKADLNGDNRDEVLIAFASPEAGYINNPDVPEPRYSYLIMRYLPRGSKTARTVIMNDDKYAWHTVDAFCDLDGDGWAEILGSSGAQDYGSDFLYHWNGKRFQTLSGCGGGG